MVLAIAAAFGAASWTALPTEGATGTGGAAADRGGGGVGSEETAASPAEGFGFRVSLIFNLDAGGAGSLLFSTALGGATGRKSSSSSSSSSLTGAVTLAATDDGAAAAFEAEGR
jgi:hypothetical protein